MAKLWIARWRNNSLYLYNHKPHKVNNLSWWANDGTFEYNSMPLDSDMFPEVTYENSPVEVTLTVAIGGKEVQDNDSTTKPKYKVGDWASTTQPEHTSPVQIVDKDNVDYRIEDTNGNSGVPSLEWFDKVYHPWTIQDAKDGDVLVCDGKYGQEIGVIKQYVGKYGGCQKCFETYFFVDWEGIFRTGEYMGSKEIHPATKEQRDLLFAKMKEAGYDWDAEKKQVIKINPMEGLRPCPFCGREPNYLWRGSRYMGFYVSIKCAECNVTMEYVGYNCTLKQVKKAAASRWNTRLF